MVLLLGAVSTNALLFLLGLQLHDTCDDDDLVENHLFDVISGTRDIIESSGPPLLGEREDVINATKRQRQMAGPDGPGGIIKFFMTRQ